ncbi:MAG: hypothetical protein RIC55_06840 [Pirellulaceae bacterium]
MRRLLFRAATVLSLTGLTAIVGCSGDQEVDLMPVHPVVGVLTYQGDPMSRAVIIYHPESKSVVGGTVTARGVADENGRYQLTSFTKDDGAPAGNYKVTIYWPEPGPEEADPLPPDRLKGVYAKEKTPKLDAEVSEGENTIDFKLP